MKKLNKGLSLVLVLAMVLSMFSVSAFATNAAGKTYTDADEITTLEGKEAIEVLTGLGVLVGNSTDAETTFGPAGDFTRGQAAKIVSYLVAGTEYVDNLGEMASGFSDTDGWSDTYVRYASERDIIAGYGNGKFGPKDTLTEAQWLKMLLCAIGYDPDACGLVGDYWEQNTLDLAMTVGLLKAGEIEDGKFNREWAAIYAYRAIQIPLKPVVYTVTTASGTVTKTYGADLSGVTLNEKNFNIDFTRNYKYGAFHRPAGYDINDTDGNLIANVKDWTLDKEYDDEFPASVDGAEIYVDGVAATALPATANGTRTEVYTLGNGKTAVIVLTDKYVVEDGVSYIENIDVNKNVENKAEAAFENHRIEVVVYKTYTDIKDETGKSYEGDYSLNEDMTPFNYQDINKRTFTIYYDHAGHAIHMEQVRFGTSDVYVLGMRARVSYDVSASNLFVAEPDYLAQAMIIDLNTGAVSVVDIATTTYLGGYYYADVNYEPSRLNVVSVNIDPSSIDAGGRGTIQTNRNQTFIPVVNNANPGRGNRGFYQMTTLNDGCVVFTKKYDNYVVSTSHGNPIITVEDHDCIEDTDFGRSAIATDNNVHTDEDTYIRVITYYVDGTAEPTVDEITGWKNFTNSTYTTALVYNEHVDRSGYNITHGVIAINFVTAARDWYYFTNKNLAGGTDGIPTTSIDRDIYYFVKNDEVFGRYANDYDIIGAPGDFQIPGEGEPKDKTTLDDLYALMGLSPWGDDEAHGYLVTFVDYPGVYTAYNVKVEIPTRAGVVVDGHSSEYVILDESWSTNADNRVQRLDTYTMIDEEGYFCDYAIGDYLEVYDDIGVIINHGEFYITVNYNVTYQEYVAHNDNTITAETSKETYPVKVSYMDVKNTGIYTLSNVADIATVGYYQTASGWNDVNGNPITGIDISTHQTRIFPAYVTSDIEYGMMNPSTYGDLTYGLYDNHYVIEVYADVNVSSDYGLFAVFVQNDATNYAEKFGVKTAAGMAPNYAKYVQIGTTISDPKGDVPEIQALVPAGYTAFYYEAYDPSTGLLSTRLNGNGEWRSPAEYMIDADGTIVDEDDDGCKGWIVFATASH